MKRLFIVCSVIILLIALFVFIKPLKKQRLEGIGYITEGFIHDENSWDKKGYNGLRAIGDEFGVGVHYKEGVQSKHETINVVDELVNNGVNLIFGSSNVYGRYFAQITQEYPNVHFVYFNGGFSGENLTSLNFSSHAMGFFGGMVASKMSNTNQVGIIAAEEWQPEIEGFYEGVKYQNPETKVHIDYVNHWNGMNKAQEVYEGMRNKHVDVFYPAGDSYSDLIIELASKEDAYVIGYVSDQLETNSTTVLTSTVQHVEEAYKHSSEKFNQQKLEGGIIMLEFQDGFVSLGEFSELVPEEFQTIVNEYIKTYLETSLLPNEQ